MQTFRIEVPEGLIADPDQAVRTHQQIAEPLAGVAGRDVGGRVLVADDGRVRQQRSRLRGRRRPPDGPMPPIRRFKWVGPGYVETMGNRLLAGRLITWDDAYKRAQVVVISEHARAGVLQDRRSGHRQAHPQQPQQSLARDRGRRRRRARRRALTSAPPAIVYWPLLINDFWTDEVVRAAQPGVRRAVGADGLVRLHERTAAGGLVGQPEPAARERPVARGDPRELDGADVLRPDDAGDCRRRGAAARPRRASTASSPTSRRSGRGRSACAWRSARRPPISGRSSSRTG